MLHAGTPAHMSRTTRRSNMTSRIRTKLERSLRTSLKKKAKGCGAFGEITVDVDKTGSKCRQFVLLLNICFFLFEL